MALIKCPECGQEVSDKAVACPKCAAPISGADEVKISASIKLLSTSVRSSKSSAVINKMKIYNCNDNNLLWEGVGGEVVTLKLKEPTTIKLKMRLGLKNIKHMKHAKWGLADFTKTIEPGKRYVITLDSGLFKTTYDLTEVDNID